MDKYFNNTSLIQVVLKWKWHVTVITLVAAILGAVFSSSYFITPLYKSEAILYPSNVSAYSDETFSEQMLQIIQSQDIMDSVVEKFNLMEHYNIDKSYKYWKTALIGEYRDRVSISKTSYDGVQIKVLDKDPQMACDIVNSIIYYYDKKVAALHKIKRLETVYMYKRQLDEKMQFIDSLKKEMTFISNNYGIINYQNQAGEITRGYLKTVDGNGSHINDDGVKELKANFAQYGPDILSLSSLIEAESRNYTTIKLDYEQQLRFYNADMTFSNIVSHPFVADKKAYPIRWVVVALCGMCAFLLSILFIYIFDNKEVKE